MKNYRCSSIYWLTFKRSTHSTNTCPRNENTKSQNLDRICQKVGIFDPVLIRPDMSTSIFFYLVMNEATLSGTRTNEVSFDKENTKKLYAQRTNWTIRPHNILYWAI